jgi:hypothetical protein
MDLSPLSQAALTVIIGVAVYALGQIVVKFLIEPVDQLSQMIGEVLDSLVYYSNVYTNPVIGAEPREMTELRNEAQNKLRQKATLLMSKASRVRLYSLASFFRIVPRRESVNKAHGELIFLSNSCFLRMTDSLRTFESSENVKKLLTSKEWNPSNTITCLAIYASILVLAYSFAILIVRVLQPLLQIITLRLGPVDLFGFLVPLAISLVLLARFGQLSKSRGRKIALLFILILSTYIALQARAGLEIGNFNTEILKYIVIINSFAALVITYGLHYPPPIPSRRTIIQSFSGAAVSWVSTILSEIPAYYDWAQQGVLWEKLNYMVLGGNGLFDVLFYWGFVTALCILVFQVLLVGALKIYRKNGKK